MAARDSSLDTAPGVPGARGHEVRAGIATPAEEAARGSLRECSTAPLRLLAASTVLAFLGIAAASCVAAATMGRLLPTSLVVGLSMLSLPPAATSEALGVFLLFAGVSLSLSASARRARSRAGRAARP